MFSCCWSSSPTKAEIITQIERDEAHLALKRERLETLSKLYTMHFKELEITRIKENMDSLPKKVWKDLLNRDLERARKLIDTTVKDINRIFQEIYAQGNMAVFRTLQQTIDTFFEQRQAYQGTHVGRVQNIFTKKINLEPQVKGLLAAEAKVFLKAHELFFDNMLDVAVEIGQVELLLSAEEKARYAVPIYIRNRMDRIDALKTCLEMLRTHSAVYCNHHSLDNEIMAEIKKTHELITYSAELQDDIRIRDFNLELEEQASVLEKLVGKIMSMSTIKEAPPRKSLDDSTFIDPNEVKAFSQAASKYASPSPVDEEVVNEESEGNEPASSSSNSPRVPQEEPTATCLPPSGKSLLVSSLGRKSPLSPFASSKVTALSPTFLQATALDRAMIPTPTATDAPLFICPREISSPSPPPPISFHNPWVKVPGLVFADSLRGAEQARISLDSAPLPNVVAYASARSEESPVRTPVSVRSPARRAQRFYTATE